MLLRLPKIFCTFNTWEFSKHLFHVSTNVSTYQDHIPDPVLLAAGPRQGGGSAQTQPSSHAPSKQKVLSRNPAQLFRHTDLVPCKMFKEQQRITNQILEPPPNALDVTQAEVRNSRADTPVTVTTSPRAAQPAAASAFHFGVFNLTCLSPLLS